MFYDDDDDDLGLFAEFGSYKSPDCLSNFISYGWGEFLHFILEYLLPHLDTLFQLYSNFISTLFHFASNPIPTLFLHQSNFISTISQ